MRSFRFLLSRRWVLFAVAVAVLVYGTWWLGSWQFGRLQDKRHSNAVIRANEQAKPAPADEVLAVGHDVSDEHEWRRVTATGTYDTAHSIIWRYRSGDHSRNGVDIVVPLVTTDGTTLLVDRGWMPTEDQDHPVTPPAPPSGTVTVVGWARANATGDATTVTRFGDLLGTRALSSVTASPAIGHRTYGGFVSLQSEKPQASRTLEQVALPELDDGPHFFYGIQWWFFGALAVIGFFYLMYDERRALHKATDTDATAEAAESSTDEAAPAVDEPQRTVETAPQPTPRPPEPAATPSGSGDPRERVRAERKARRTAKNARKQAVRAAYQAAYAREKDHEARQSDRIMPPSTGTIAPETKEEAGDSRNAATRPNSSGRP